MPRFAEPIRFLHIATIVSLMLLMSAGAGAELKLSVDSDLLTVDGLSEGGEVVVVFAGRRWTQAGVPRSATYREVAVDDDADGIVEIQLRAKPAHAVLIAVDVSTGEPGILFHATRSRFLEADLFRVNDEKDSLTVPMRRAVMLWVRPGGGAWSSVIADGAPDDVDFGVRGSIEWPLDRLESQSLQTASAPLFVEKAAANDIVALVDLRTLDATLFQVPSEEGE